MKAVEAPVDRRLLVLVAHEAARDSDVRVRRQAHRVGACLERGVVVRHPLAGLVRVDEAEAERAKTSAARHQDRVALTARHPHRRVRALGGLGHHVAGRHREELAGMALVRRLGHHLGDLGHRFFPHRPLVGAGDLEAAEFHVARRLAGAELHPAVRDDVERADALGHPRRVVVAGQHRHDAVTDADVLGRRSARRQEHLGRSRMRVLLEEVVLHLPHSAETQLVGQLHLLERLVNHAGLGPVVPRPRQLVLVEDAEAHAWSLLEG